MKAISVEQIELAAYHAMDDARRIVKTMGEQISALIDLREKQTARIVELEKQIATIQTKEE